MQRGRKRGTAAEAGKGGQEASKSGGGRTRETKPEAGDGEASLGFRGFQEKKQTVADHRC